MEGLRLARRVARTFPGLVLLLGVAMLYAWSEQAYRFVSLGSDVTMKPATAAAFVLTACGGLFLRGAREARDISIWFHIGAIVAMVWTLVGYYIGGPLVSGLFSEPVEQAADSVAPGVPSWGTAAGFCLLGLSGVSRAVRGVSLHLFDGLAAAIAAVALLGYALDVPKLYYLVQDASSAMAFATAIGLAMLSLSRLLDE